MNNEIGRKLTSLTLMTIMLAGGMVIAAPSMVPEAAAAGQLYVSAENTLFNNTFGGAQVVEIVVRDPNRSDTEVAESQPTVTVDSHDITMAQGADGFWYAYIADYTASNTANGTTNNVSFGVSKLPRGYDSVLGTDSTTPLSEMNATNTATIWVSTNGATGPSIKNGTSVVQSPPTLSAWNGTNPTLPVQGLSAGNKTIGQIGIQHEEWPMIQTFAFDIGVFDIVLEQAGPDEIVTLDYNSADLMDFAGIEIDRPGATQGSQVHLTITDNQLNLDPTNEDIVIFRTTTGSEGVSFADSSNHDGAASTGVGSHTYLAYDNNFGDNGVLIIDRDAQSIGTDVLLNDYTEDDTVPDVDLVFFETAANSGIFVNTDDKDDANLVVNTDAKRGTSATIDYNDSAQSFIVTNDFGTIDMDETSVGDVWNSGESLTVTLRDQDLNQNTASGEDLVINNRTNTLLLVPAMQIGSPLMVHNDTVNSGVGSGTLGGYTLTVDAFSNIARYTNTSASFGNSNNFTINTGILTSEVLDMDTRQTFWNFDFSAFVNSATAGVDDVCLTNRSLHFACASQADNKGTDEKGMVIIYNAQGIGTTDGTVTDLEITIELDTAADVAATAAMPFVSDIFSFGIADDGTRQNNAIYRLLLEETGDNTGEFVGSIEYVMLNQLNTDQAATYIGLTTIGSSVDIIVHEDLTDEDSPRINYNDLGADGVTTQIADQVAAPSHSGVVTFDLANYKIADTVIVTVDDQDLNTDSGLIDIYVTKSDDKVGDGSGDHILDITFNDALWVDAGSDATDCNDGVGSTIEDISGSDGLQDSGFTLVETGLDSGIFVGSFQVPSNYCLTDGAGGNTDEVTTTTGTDIEANYNDYRDASGETIEVGAGASINANTGTVSFDRTVYPVPYGSDATNTRFAEHATSTGDVDLAQGNVVVHIRISDPDYNVSAQGEDKITTANVTINLQRGSDVRFVATVGNISALATGGITEVSPDSGVFEYDQTITYTQGPSTGCPSAFTAGCLLQGDIITVEYTDQNDASGKSQTVTDSATFDLRNGVLQSDKSVYLIGSDMILTLIEPDFDLDNDGAESLTLNLIEWDSDAATTVLGAGGTTANAAAFDPEPGFFRETGDSTGIFQVVIEVPEKLTGASLDRGEKIDLEYTDWGPAGADYVGQEDEDIGLTVYTSNFGATIELDQKVYSWTDKVYITIVAPDHNFDSGLVDEIGDTANDPVKVSTRGNSIDKYKLVESGADTGIFIGEVTLAGMKHDADGDGVDDISLTAKQLTSNQSVQSGPTEGKLATTDNDGLTVSFEYSEDETVVGSALIRWNIGEVQWLEASYPASGTGVVRIIDADMNLNPEAVDNFAVDAWSDSDAGGIDLTVTETNEATGIFEGTVFFTVSNDSSGHRLRVAEGDTVTAEYEDNTLPEPYTTADELDITATTLIGTIVPPLERAPAANLRTVDAFGNSLNAVGVDQQVQLTADLANGQDREQAFAYLVQIQDGDGVTVSLAWITGSLAEGQSFSPALSWIPTEGGSYTATAFVWESVDNPTALSPPVSTTITVQ